MQLDDALKCLAAIGECAEAEHVDADLRLAWIGHYVAEHMAAAAGDYGTAQLHKTKCNALSSLMRLYVNSAARSGLNKIAPIVIGGVDLDDEGDVENALYRSVWDRRFPPAKGD